MDAFFASIEQRDRPELRGRPVVVGGSQHGRGVVAAASYEARKFGIHSAMSGKRAAQLCPHAVFVKGDHRLYAEVGRQVREILERFSPVIQPLSCDEAFLDVSGTLPHFATLEAMCRQIKTEIRDELQLTASVGAAPLKFIAKIASDFGKPDGCVIVTADAMQDFLDPLPIGRLWGVGDVAGGRLKRLGIHTIGQMRILPADAAAALGGWAAHLHRLANCIDPRPVQVDRTAKQISHERTFSTDLVDEEAMLAVVNFLADQVCRRLRRSGRLAKSVSVKYRTGDFRTYSRVRRLPEPVDNLDTVWPSLLEMFTALRAAQGVPVRLIGVGLSELSSINPPRQLSLFDQGQIRSRQSVDCLTDRIAARHGPQSIYRGTAHRWASGKHAPEARPKTDDE